MYSQPPRPGRLVFVAVRAIQANEELTIDYHPSMERRPKSSVTWLGKPVFGIHSQSRLSDDNLTKAEAEEGTERVRCVCNASNCRGFFTI
jgi:SET domain-containing protein